MEDRAHFYIFDVFPSKHSMIQRGVWDCDSCI